MYQIYHVSMLGLRRDMYLGTLGKLWSEAYGLISLASNLGMSAQCQ